MRGREEVSHLGGLLAEPEVDIVHQQVAFQLRLRTEHAVSGAVNTMVSTDSTLTEVGPVGAYCG